MGFTVIVFRGYYSSGATMIIEALDVINRSDYSTEDGYRESIKELINDYNERFSKIDYPFKWDVYPMRQTYHCSILDYPYKK